MADGFYRLTYRDIADRLGISPDAARMKANRKAKAGHWRLLPDETPGQERLVEIPSADLDGIVAKAAPAERSAPVDQAEQAAPAHPVSTAERPVSAEQPAPAEQAAPAEGAERSAPVEPYVPPKISVSFDPQHPHMPPATAERSRSSEPNATAEQAAPAAAIDAPEQAVQAEQTVEAEQPAPAEQAAVTEQAAPAEQAASIEQPVPAEQVATAERVEAQPEPRSDDDELEANAEGAEGDELVSSLTSRNSNLTDRLLEETNARKTEREELEASAVREAELKVEIERLCARVSELTAELEQAARPWYRGLFQGRYGDR